MRGLLKRKLRGRVGRFKKSLQEAGRLFKTTIRKFQIKHMLQTRRSTNKSMKMPTWLDSSVKEMLESFL